MSKIALVVTFKLHKDKREPFIDRVKIHAATCLAHEKGCLQFDVIVPNDHKNKVMLFEVYENTDALNHHDGTQYMAEFREDISAFVKKRKRVQCRLIES